MKNKEDQLDTLKEIRSLMENSSRFMSLSGLSGVIAGIAALSGIFAAYLFLEMEITDPGYYLRSYTANGEVNNSFYYFFMIDICMVFIISLMAASLLTIKKAKKQGKIVWDSLAKRLLINMLIPIITGAVLCISFIYNNHLELIAPSTLIFYGLALINSSKYTLNDIRYLGLIQIATGLFASFYFEYALLFWAFGFGLMHIVYGITMYYKYEK